MKLKFRHTLLAAALLSSAVRAQTVPEPQRESSPPPAPAAITPPRLLGELPRPEYPPGATGTSRVVVQVDVDTEGAVSQAAVVTPPQPRFDESALAIARTLRFEPARQGEAPIPVRLQLAFNFAPPPPPRTRELPVNLAGEVRERGSRRKLAGIEVTCAGQSAFTDAQGRFELRGVPPGAQPVVIAAPGYQRFEATETIETGRKLEVAYRLQPQYGSPFEATVVGERDRRELSRTDVSIEEVNRIPGTQGDALKVIEDLPGVARTSPIGGGLLVVRGSKPGDSLVYLDGLNLPLLFHFGALSSTVTPDLLSGIEFIPGNFSVGYGDLTGGLVEVKTRPLREEVHGFANLNLLEGSALLEGQVTDGVRVSVSGRRSYVDAVLRAVFSGNNDIGLTAAPVYYDGQVRLDWKPRGSKHSLHFLALTSDDKLALLLKRPAAQDPNISGDLDLETGFSQLRLKHGWREGAWSIDTTGMYEHLLLRFGIGAEKFSLVGNDLYLRSIATYEASDSLALSAGFESINRHVNVSARFRLSALVREGDPNQNVGPRADDPDDVNVSALPFNRYSPALFAEARWKPVPGLTLTPGLRFDSYIYTGQPTRTRTLTPRLSARWELNDAVALKAGAGFYSQGARNGDASFQFGNPAVLPERAFQVTAGTELRPWQGFFFSAETFYKKLDDLIVSTPGERIAGQLLDNAGAGRVFGIEFLLRRELTDRLFGWIAYTLSRSDRVDRPGEPRRLFDFDQTHNLTAIASYKLGRGWQLGARLRIISGNPDTPVLGARYLALTDSYAPIFGLTNSTRLPLFHQLDLRLDKVWTFDAWQLDAYLDVLNAYNHRSIEGTQFSYDYSQSAPIQGLPVFPSLGLKGSF